MMKTYCEYLEDVKLSLIKENKKAVDRVLNTKPFIIERKLNNFYAGKQKSLKDHYRKLGSAWIKHKEYYGYIKLEDFIDYIKSSGMAYTILSAEFTRQGIFEKAFKLFVLTEIKVINNFKSLPGKTYDLNNPSVYLDIMGNLTNNKSVGGTKSLDFYGESAVKNIYFYHKHVEEAGGGQDNQIADIANFIRCSKENKDVDKLFIAVLDGKYGHEQIQKLKDDYLISESDKDRVIITCSENLQRDIS